MAEIVMIFDRPTPGILDDLVGVAGCRESHSRAQGRDARRLRASAWASLLRLRAVHGSLAEARRVAELRALIIRAAAAGRVS
jgi:hypothetical protein